MNFNELQIILFDLQYICIVSSFNILFYYYLYRILNNIEILYIIMIIIIEQCN